MLYHAWYPGCPPHNGKQALLSQSRSDDSKPSTSLLLVLISYETRRRLTHGEHDEERANFQLAMYATHLATGSSLHCRTSKSSTILSCYLLDIATFLGRFGPIDPRFVLAADTALAPAIAKILAEQKRWETVSNRREPFTLDMYSAIATLASTKWMIVVWKLPWQTGLFAIYMPDAAVLSGRKRNSNTAQSARFTSLASASNAYAFALVDIQCFTAQSSPTTLEQALLSPSHVGKLKLRFEQQTNKENHEWKLFTRNHEKPSLYFITNFLQILARHKRLTNSCPRQPLSIYRGQDAASYNITTMEVDNLIRQAAVTVYKLDRVQHRAILQLWSSHSLRVGTCTLLYAKGFSDTEIMFLLHWKSDAFMSYLRNLAVTSRRQNTAVNDGSEIPNFV
jgi:hypothetical protein